VPPSPLRSYTLTRRQFQIAVWLRQGLTDQAIADQLQLSKRTVSNNLSLLYSQTGVSSRAHLVFLLERNALNWVDQRDDLLMRWSATGLMRRYSRYMGADPMTQPLISLLGIVGESSADNLVWLVDDLSKLDDPRLDGEALQFNHAHSRGALRSLVRLRRWAMVAEPGACRQAVEYFVSLGSIGPRVDCRLFTSVAEAERWMTEI